MSNKETKGKMTAYPDWNALKSEIAWYNTCSHNVGEMIIIGDDVWRVVGKDNCNVAIELVYPKDDRRLSSTVSEAVILVWSK